MKKSGYILIIAAGMALTAGCSSNEISSLASSKYHTNRGRGDDVAIGVNWSDESSELFNGVMLAVDKINKSGGLLGKNIRVIRRSDGENLEKAKEIAREFGRDMDVIAVIGGQTSDITIPASVIYEKYNLPSISPSATSPELTRTDFKYIFRNVLNDYEMIKAGARDILRYLQQNGGPGNKRIIVLHDESRYGKGLAYSFQINADKNGFNIIKSFGYSSHQPDYNKIIKEIRDEEFDALLLAGLLPAAGEFIVQMRRSGVEELIISGDGIDSSSLIAITGELADNLLVLTHVNPLEELSGFRDAYTERYGSPPDMYSALGYDAANLIADLYEKTGSFDSLKFTREFHYLSGWEGITGIHNFNEKGDVTGKPVRLKYYAKGEYFFID